MARLPRCPIRRERVVGPGARPDSLTEEARRRPDLRRFRERHGPAAAAVRGGVSDRHAVAAGETRTRLPRGKGPGLTMTTRSGGARPGKRRRPPPRAGLRRRLRRRRSLAEPSRPAGGPREGGADTPPGRPGSTRRCCRTARSDSPAPSAGRRRNRRGGSTLTANRCGSAPRSPGKCRGSKTRSRISSAAGRCRRSGISSPGTGRTSAPAGGRLAGVGHRPDSSPTGSRSRRGRRSGLRGVRRPGSSPESPALPEPAHPVNLELSLRSGEGAGVPSRVSGPSAPVCGSTPRFAGSPLPMSASPGAARWEETAPVPAVPASPPSS